MNSLPIDALWLTLAFAAVHGPGRLLGPHRTGARRYLGGLELIDLIWYGPGNGGPEPGAEAETPSVFAAE